MTIRRNVRQSFESARNDPNYLIPESESEECSCSCVQKTTVLRLISTRLEILQVSANYFSGFGRSGSSPIGKSEAAVMRQVLI